MLVEFLETAFVAGGHAALFGFGQWLHLHYMTQDVGDEKSAWVGWLFGCSFSVSVAMLLLLILELCGGLSVTLRRSVWSWEVCAILLLLYFLIPVGVAVASSQIITEASPSRDLLGVGAKAVGAVSMLWLIFCVSGAVVGLPMWAIRTDMCFARVSVVGVTLVAALAAFGAVQFPYQHLGSLWRPVQRREMTDAEERLRLTMSLIGEKKRELFAKQEEALGRSCFPLYEDGSRELEEHDRSRSKESGGGDAFLLETDGMLGKLWKRTLGRTTDSAERKQKALLHEIAALEAVANEMFLGLNELAESRLRELHAATCVGKIQQYSSVAMSLICLYRIALSAMNVTTRHVGSQDPVTLILSKVFHWLRIPLDIGVWVQPLSLIFIAFLIGMNVRAFVARLLSVFRFVSSRRSSDLLALGMAEIMGLYFAACTLLMRLNLPQDRREGVTEALGKDLDFSAFHLHFDLIFGASAVVKILVLTFYHSHRLQKYKNR